MVSGWRAVLLLIAASAAGSCATVDETRDLPSPDDTASIAVRLSYTRPAEYGSDGRPGGFEVIANYRSSDDTAEYDGTWNDQTRTLTANVQLPVGSENLVYIIDEAVPPFIPTPVQAVANGRLRQIGCPAAVTTVQVCYELSVIR